jgi:acyl carrier protein
MDIRTQMAQMHHQANQLQQILNEFQSIVRYVIDDESIILTMETTARDVSGWDSLANIRIVLSAERTFGFRVSTTEIMALRNVGDFVRLVFSRQTIKVE